MKVFLLFILLCFIYISLCNEILRIRSLPEESFYINHHIKRNQDCSTSKLKEFIGLTKLLYIPTLNLPNIITKGSIIEIIIDSNTKEDSFLSWKRENWIKNGLLNHLSNTTTCRVSTHSLSSIIGINNVMIISDQVKWTENTYSLPEFFKIYETQEGYNKNQNNIIVYDISSDCKEYDWHSNVKLILKEQYCPFLLSKSNIMWTPRGWDNSIIEGWYPSSIIPSYERYYFFYISQYETTLLELFDDYNIYFIARGKIQDTSQSNLQEFIYLRDSVFTFCSVNTIQNTCIYNALLQGTIPIIITNIHFKETIINSLGELPFPIVISYNDIIPLLEYSLYHLNEVYDLQKTIITWFDQKLFILQKDLLNKWFL